MLATLATAAAALVLILKSPTRLVRFKFCCSNSAMLSLKVVVVLLLLLGKDKDILLLLLLLLDKDDANMDCRVVDSVEVETVVFKVKKKMAS